jgi:hypothetical protein
MRKIISLSIIAVLVLSMGGMAFAAEDDNTQNEVPSWYKDMLKWREEQMQNAQQNGNITNEQAQYWNAANNYMQGVYNQNRFGNQNWMGFRGAYGRGFAPPMPQSFGPGMMGTYCHGMGW